MIFLYFASDSFASRAKVLTDSIKKHHPEDTIVHVKPENGPLGEYLPGMAKQRLEKALELLESQDRESVCVIGADCELFAPLFNSNEAFCASFLNDVLIVPHVQKPLKDRQYMLQLYQTGHANADLMIFANTDNSKNILKWLISVTEDGFKNGAFYEQTWLSSLPFLFDGVGILRHPGYNVGYWSINHEDFRFKDGQYFVNDQPLVMMQYSGFQKGKALQMSKHSRETAKNSLIYEFYKNYDDRIDK